MKIICIGRNYVDHAKELKNDVPDKPIFFLKPETALVRNNQPFFYPEFSKDIHHEVEIVLRVNRVGKNIEKQFAHRYYSDVGLGLDLTARDLQNEARKNGLPWEIAKAFDNSAVLGQFILLTKLPNSESINFSLQKNDEVVQEGNTKDLIFSFDEIISYVSQFLTLKIGDLIFTGTPAGVGSLKIGDKLTGFIEDKKVLECEVK